MYNGDNLDDKLVSVIVPVYNTENFIGRCIESILSQTHKNIEVLLIDDGSKDNSYAKCAVYAEKYSNITVIHQDNFGAGHARNVGIAHANGEFIVFVDSDDTIDKNHIAGLLKAYKRNNSLVLCGYKKVFKDHKEYYSPGNKELDKNDFAGFYNEWLIEPVIGSPCNKLIEAEVIKKNNLRYPEGLNFAEDFIFSTKLFDCVDSVTTIDSCSYNYYMETPDSLTKVSGVDTKKWWNAEKYVYRQIQTCSFFKGSNVPQKILCFMAYMNYMQQLKGDKRLDKDFLADFKKTGRYRADLQGINSFKPYFSTRKQEFLYRLMRISLLTDIDVLHRCINYMLHTAIQIKGNVKS